MGPAGFSFLELIVSRTSCAPAVSEFVGKWSKRSGHEIQKMFIPPPGKPAHDVVIKRGEVFSLRFYAPAGGGLNVVSKKIESFRVVRGRRKNARCSSARATG